MKKIWFIAFLFLTFAVCKSAAQITSSDRNSDFSPAAVSTFSPESKTSLYYNWNLSKSLNSENLLSGLSFSLFFLEFKCFYNNKSCGISLKASTGDLGETFSSFPITLKIGNNRFSGSISKLNSPLLSSGTSPLSSAINQASSIQCDTVSSSSFTEDYSLFLQGEIKARKNTFLINGYYFCDENPLQTFALSLKDSIRPSKNLKAGISLTSGFFPFSEKKLSSWFNQENFYTDGNLFCTSLQADLSLPFFTGFFMINAYESPFETLSFVFRNENKIKTKRFTFLLSESLNPENNILTSSKSINKSLLVKSALQYHFTIISKRPFFITTGTSSYFDFTPDSDSHNFKLAAGLKMISDYFSASYSLTISGTYEKELLFTGAAFSAKNSIYVRGLKTAVNVNVSLTPESDYKKWDSTEKITLTFYVPGSFHITNSNSISLSQKDFIQEKIEYQTSLTLKLSLKYFYLSCKLSWAYS